MYKQIEKPKENKSRSLDNSVTQKNNVMQAFGFVDNRPKVVIQSKLQEMANNSPKVIRLNAKQQMTNNDTQVKKPEMSANTVLQREKLTLEQGESVGKIVYSLQGEIRGEGEAYEGIVLVDISVPNGERNKGYGAKLMTKFMEDIVGSNPCYLDVLSHNKAEEEGLSNADLEKWYGKYGFTSLGKSGWGDNTIMGINVPIPTWEERGIGVEPAMNDYLSKLVK